MSKAIFLGSFNPPHKGHYELIKNFVNSGLMEKHDIDKVHIIPCHQNPNKNKTLDYIHRYRMCTKMFSDLCASGKVIIDDIEDKICPKYTYELIEYFKSNKDAHIKDNFWWIITIETIKELIDDKWAHSDELLYDNNFIIVYGQYANIEDIKGIKKLIDENKIRAICIPIKTEVDYHSTDIRELISHGKSVEELTNKDVQNYILENKLYKTHPPVPNSYLSFESS